MNDGELSATWPAFSLRVIHPPLGRNNVRLADDTQRTNTDTGYEIIGNASIVVSDLDMTFSEADLQFEFDEEGNLLDLTGDSILPPVISN